MTRPIAVAGHLRIYLPTCEEISLLVYCIILGSMLPTVSLDAKSRKYLSDNIERKKKNYGKPHFLVFYLLGVHVFTCCTFGTHMRVCVRESVWINVHIDVLFVLSFIVCMRACM